MKYGHIRSIKPVITCKQLRKFNIYLNLFNIFFINISMNKLSTANIINSIIFITIILNYETYLIDFLFSINY